MVSVECPIIILAAGHARRFGGPKGLAPLAGRPLIQHVIDRVTLQSRGPIAINAAMDSPYAGLGLPLIPDRRPGGQGPLAGVEAGLIWARGLGADELLCVPLDLPLLPQELLETLQAAGAPAVARSGGRDHPSCGLWRTRDLPLLTGLLDEDRRAMMAWCAAVGAKSAAFSRQDTIDPFLNINTPEDLAVAERILAAKEP